LSNLPYFSEAVEAAHDHNADFQNHGGACDPLSCPHLPRQQVAHGDAQEKREHHGVQMKKVEARLPVEFDPGLGILAHDHSADEKQNKTGQNRRKTFQRG